MRGLGNSRNAGRYFIGNVRAHIIGCLAIQQSRLVDRQIVVRRYPGVHTEKMQLIVQYADSRRDLPETYKSVLFFGEVVFFPELGKTEFFQGGAWRFVELQRLPAIDDFPWVTPRQSRGVTQGKSA